VTPEPRQIRSIDIDIDAPAEMVWGVLIDFANYARWNSFTPRIGTHLPPDNPIGTPLRLFVPSMKGAAAAAFFTHYLRVFDRPRHLAWEHPPEPLSMHLTRRDQYLEPLTSGGCRYWSTDTFFGDTADELYARHGDWVQRGLDTIAVELKAEAERIAHAAIE
jgi:hypothetical protein